MTAVLPVLVLVPLAAAGLLLLLRPADPRIARWAALASSLLTLGLAAVVAGAYARRPPAIGEGILRPVFEFRRTWMTLDLPGSGPDARLEFYLGLDGPGLLMVLLTALLTVTVVLASWYVGTDEPGADATGTDERGPAPPTRRTASYFAALLGLEAGLLGAFTSFDLLLFYCCFEFTLIPAFFLIGVWGGPERSRAAYRFVIYTLVGSLFTLVGLAAVGLVAAARRGLTTPFSIPDLADAFAADPLPQPWQVGLFLAIAVGFAVKLPLVPLHTWQPLAYVQSPPASTALIAGVLSKLGGFGFYRVVLPLLPAAVVDVGVPVLGTLAVAGILYGGLAAVIQRDMRRMLAYSSISHGGVLVLGLFAVNVEGVVGGVLQMVNLGLSTGALFLILAMVGRRYGTTSLDRLGGLATRLPLLTVCLVFACLASVGLPTLNGFVSEYLSLSGMFATRPTLAILGTATVVLGAWYLLTMLMRGFFGPLREPEERPQAVVPDLKLREAILLAPLLGLCLAIGVFPRPLIRVVEPDVARLVRLYPAFGPAGRTAVTTPGEGGGADGGDVTGDDAAAAGDEEGGPDRG